MVNPILTSTSNTYSYLTIWALIAGVHGFVLTYFYDIPLQIAMVDSAIFNLLFCGLGLSLWYVVRFINVEQQGIGYVLVNHMATGVVALSLWLFISKWLTTTIFNDNTVYQTFTDNSLPWRFLIGLLFYSVIVLLYYLITYYMSFQEKTRQEANLNALVKDAELAMLRSQINPHFIFNSLNSISSLTMAFPERAQEMTIKLSDFLRYSLSQDNKQLASLSEEMSNVGLYMDIEKTRFGSRLQFEPRIEEGCQGLLLPNMILQPLFENAIKHGVYESLEPVTIRFDATKELRNLRITLWNNFDPDATTTQKGSGIGLSNIRSRLLVMYGREDLLSVNCTENTYEVSLLIPQF
jgi:two-component system, LytTR family, sensor kinase